MKKLINLLNIAIASLFLFLFLFSIIKQGYIRELISSEIEAYGFFFIFLVSALLEFIPQYVTPYVILINAEVIGISISQLLIFTIAGSVIGSLIGFETGRKYGLGFVENIYNEKEIMRIQKKTNNYGKWFVLVAAISPLPYIPIIFGFLNLTRKNFIIFGVIPRVIGLLLFGFLLMQYI